MSNNRLLTYEQCKEIVSKNENFYEKVIEKNGFKVSIFDYILSIYSSFKNPIEGQDLSAYEMRGLTFIHSENSSPKRYLMLNKFFNLNENEDYQLNLLINNRIVSIQEKLDGSMIRPIMFPDGSILCKTKSGLDNTQSIMATSLVLENNELLEFVKDCLNNNLAPIFELCSPMNRIVVSYDLTKLVLLQLRDESSGEYLDIYEHPLLKKYSGVEKAQKQPLVDFETLLEQQRVETNKEGYIVTLENGLKFKIKNQWYLERHRLIDNISNENLLIELICKDKLDDEISLLDKDNEVRKYSEEIQKFIVHKINEIFNECEKLLEKSKTISRKDFAISYKKEKYFSLSSSFINREYSREDLIKAIKDRLVFETRRLEMARKFLKDNGFNFQKNIVKE